MTLNNSFGFRYQGLFRNMCGCFKLGLNIFDFSRSCTVGITASYWLYDRKGGGGGVGVRVPVGSRIFTSPYCPDRLWGQPTSYPMGTGDSFPGGEVARA
jgi:hypothetical protein